MWRRAMVAVLVSSVAVAEPRVVIVETDALALPSLATRIGLHGDVDVKTVREASASGIAARAPSILTANDATFVVWVEPQGEQTFVVYLAGQAPDRALIELVRVDAATPASEVERIVSLKIANLLDVVLAPKPAAAALGAPVPEEQARWRFAFGADTAIGVDDRAFAAGPMIGGERRFRSTWDLSIHVAARTLLASAVDDRFATTSIDEYGASAGATVARGPWFASASFGGTMLVASATTPNGRRGSATELVPIVALGVGARIPVSASELAIAIGVEHAVIRQRFLVDGMVVADLGRDRGVVRLTFSLPLR